MVVEKISFESQKKGHFTTAAQEIPEPVSLLQKQLFFSLPVLVCRALTPAD